MGMHSDLDRPVRLGFLQLWDAAPLLVAGAEGYFAKLGISVEITRELGWTTIRDKLIHGELDFAHGLGLMPLAVTNGWDGPPEELVGLGVLSRNGNGITVARPYWDKGIRSGEEFAEHIRRERWRQRFVFAVVSKVSSHHILMLDWMKDLGLSPKRDAEIVQLPPGQFIRNLYAGTIDAACIGEPWNSLAAMKHSGWIAADSQSLAPNHPEKTLVTHRSMVEGHPELTAKVFAAVLAGTERCLQAEYRPELMRILSDRSALRISKDQLKQCFEHRDGLGDLPLAGLRFASASEAEWTQADFDWMANGMRDIRSDIRPQSLTPRALSRIYPNQLIKSAQPYLEELQSARV